MNTNSEILKTKLAVQNCLPTERNWALEFWIENLKMENKK